MKELIGLITVGLSFAGAIPYYIDIFRGRTKPHLYTYIVWATVTAVAFLGQYAAGGGPGSWTTGMMAILTGGVLFLCPKYGTDDITFFDTLCLVGAIATFGVWLITKDPLLSVVLATAIDCLAFVPTIRKTYRAPGSETLSSYVVNLFRHALSIRALAVYSLATYLYPLALLVMNVILVSVIVTRRKAIKK